MAMLVINFKRYDQVMYNDGALKLARLAEEAARAYKVKIAVAPPTEFLEIAKNVSVPVFAQYVDSTDCSPDRLKEMGVSGAIINHSDYRVNEAEILHWVSQTKKLDMRSIVCVETVKEAEAYRVFRPNYLAIEPKELIGTGKSVSKYRSDVIMDISELLKKYADYTETMCGAGITTGEDVSAAIDLGATGGVLVSSAMVKAPDWRAKLEELCMGLKK
jgi:triosephosphate isomerase